MMHYLVAVCRASHLKAPAEAHVLVHLGCHHAAGSLGKQDSKHAESTSYLKHTLHLGHEIRELHLKLRKLVYYYYQIRHGLRDASPLIQLKIIPYIVDLNSCPGLTGIQQLLSPHQLMPERYQVAVYLIIKIRYCTCQVWQIPEGPDKTGSLEVYEHKGNFFRRKMKCHGKDPALDHLRFSGTGSSGDKSVNPVEFLVYIKTESLSVRINTDRHRQRLVGAGAAPSGCDIYLLRMPYMIALKECYAAGQRCLIFTECQTKWCHLTRHLFIPVFQ